MRKVDWGRGPWEMAGLADVKGRAGAGRRGEAASASLRKRDEAAELTEIAQRLGQVGEVDVGSEIGMTRLRQRVYDLMLAEAL